jgi:hypothetical protein
MISPEKFQPPNPSIKTSNCISRFSFFHDFVWKSKKLPNFFIYDKLFNFLFWISWFGYLKRLHVEFSSNLSLVWKKIKILEISLNLIANFAGKNLKLFIYFQTKNNFDEVTLKCHNKKFEVKKFQYFFAFASLNT